MGICLPSVITRNQCVHFQSEICYASAILHVDCGYGLCPKLTKIVQFFPRVACVLQRFRPGLAPDALLPPAGLSEDLTPFNVAFSREVCGANGNIHGNFRRC